MSIPSSRPLPLRAALMAALIGLTLACERAPVPEGFLDPPARVKGAEHGAESDAESSAVTAPSALPQGIAPPAPPPTSPQLGGGLSRLTLTEPARLGALQDFILITPLPYLTPARALVKTPGGQEIVLRLGDAIGAGTARVSAITSTALTVSTLEVGADGIPALTSLVLPATWPAPTAAQPLDSVGQPLAPPAQPTDGLASPSPKPASGWGQ